ncbi:MAG: sulfotransferase [Phormidesmis sp.]
MTDIDFTRFPNFLIVGANKAGTTSIHNYCQQHPQVSMSAVKEPMFFTAARSWSYEEKENKGDPQIDLLAHPKFVNSLSAYQSLFNVNKQTIARGESSTSYLAEPEVAIPRIWQAQPDMKIIACLRNPVERAFSAYVMYSSADLEKRTFSQAVAEEISGKLEGIPSGMHYLKLGLYYLPIKQYMETFGRDNVLIVFFENLKNNSDSLMKDIYQFIGVDSSFEVSTEKQLNSAENWLNGKEKPEMDALTRRQCEAFFSKNIKKTKDLLSPMFNVEDISWLNM